METVAYYFLRLEVLVRKFITSKYHETLVQNLMF